MFNVHGDTCRAEVDELRMYQWNRLKKEKNLKSLVPNTNGPFVENPVSMIYECLFFFFNVKICYLFNTIIKIQIKAPPFIFFFHILLTVSSTM